MRSTSPPTSQNEANCAADCPRNGSQCHPAEEHNQSTLAEPVVKDTKGENARRHDTAEPINHICKIGQHLQDPRSALLCAGAAADVVIMSKEGLGEFLAEGRIIPASAVDLAQARLGVAVRTGTPKPDISTVEAFRQMLLRSKSINALSTTGLYLTEKLLPKLDIAGAVTSKIKGGTVATVATGEIEIAIRPVSEFVNVPGIDFVGPVPEEIQYLSIFSAAIVAGSKQVDAGQRLIHFLGSEAAEAAIRRSGMDPMKSR
jgi:molybdate transport system substrate-binding protein